MKNWKFTLIFSLLSLSGPVFAETNAACVRSAGDILVSNSTSPLVTDINGGTGSACKEAPDFYRLNFYRFGMCKVNPLSGAAFDFSSCSYLVNSTTPVAHVISYPSTSSLATNSVMEPGNYNFLILVLSNSLEQKHTETFSRSIRGKNSSGTTCWTIGVKTAYAGNAISGVTTTSPSPGTPLTLGMDCGSTPAPEYTTEIFEDFDDTGGFSADSSNPAASVKLLQTDNLTLATSPDDAKRIAVAMPMVREIKTTSSYEIGFKVVGSSSVDLHTSGVAGSTITALKVGADPFQVSFTVN